LEKTSRQSTYSAAVDFIVKWSYAPHIGQAMKKQVREIMLATRPSVLHSDLLACQGFDTQAQAAVITQPALLLVGELDKMTPPRLSEQLCELLPDARLEVIPGAGHMLMLEQPAAVAAAVRDFAQIFLEEDHPKPP
jgi:pimeloyl-ACP methyl ester carboxylesterase